MDDLERYILEQAKIEVEYTRSWPNKLLAFYVAINFGLAGSLLALASQEDPVKISDCGALLITLGIASLLVWTVSLLVRNHLSYLQYRNIQIQFQKVNLEKTHKKKFLLPDNWFKLNKINIFVRGQGWMFYFFTTVLVAAIAVSAVWGSKYV